MLVDGGPKIVSRIHTVHSTRSHTNTARAATHGRPSRWQHLWKRGLDAGPRPSFFRSGSCCRLDACGRCYAGSLASLMEAFLSNSFLSLPLSLSPSLPPPYLALVHFLLYSIPTRLLPFLLSFFFLCFAPFCCASRVLLFVTQKLSGRQSLYVSCLSELEAGLAVLRACVCG